MRMLHWLLEPLNVNEEVSCRFLLLHLCSVFTEEKISINVTIFLLDQKSFTDNGFVRSDD